VSLRREGWIYGRAARVMGQTDGEEGPEKKKPSAAQVSNPHALVRASSFPLRDELLNAVFRTPHDWDLPSGSRLKATDVSSSSSPRR